jgi:amidohydrolase
MQDRITAIIEQQKENIIQFGSTLLAHPELGYEEFFSSSFIESAYQRLGLPLETKLARTGVKARIEGKTHEITVCILSELDAVISPANTFSAISGAAHACGHSTQSTQVYAAALALHAMKDQLDGDIVCMAVPAEEFLDLQHRLELQNEGSITYLSGKQELIHLGAFDDVDMVIMIHSQPNHPSYDVFVDGSSLGFVAKNINFIGKEAHGAAPFKGVNALQAATLAMAGINANRETFSEDEQIRIHPILTKGGDIVNTVPSDVRMETYVRGSCKDAIDKGCAIVDRCVQAGASMMGAEVNIATIPGYLPLKQDKKLSALVASCAEEVDGLGEIIWGKDMIGSTDMGDLSHLMPCIQPTMGGFRGEAHSKDFCMVDAWESYRLGGELLAKLVLMLLANGASKAKQVRDSFVPRMDRETYLAYLQAQGGK